VRVAQWSFAPVLLIEHGSFWPSPAGKIDLVKSAAFLALLLGISSLEALAVFAQETKPKVPPPEEIAKLTGPGPEHQKLAEYVGDWNVVIKMNGVTGEGTAHNRMTTGGRFLFVEYETKSKVGPIEGTFTLSYDTRHQRFALMATDNFGTYFVTAQGQRDPESGKLRLLGSDDDPTMKAKGFTKEFVHVVDFRKPDEFAIEVWFVDTRTAARREFKAMEYVFTRKPPA
jgi:hypothetical protein